MGIAADDIVKELLDVLQNRPALNGVLIVDGMLFDDHTNPEAVIIGHDGDPESDARTTWTHEPASLADDTRWERGLIPCAVVSQSGDTDAEVLRQRVADLVADVYDAVYTDRTLGGTALTCRIEGGTQIVLQNERGAGVVQSFTIAYLAQV